MRHWIKPWRGLKMRELFSWPFGRTSGPQARGLHLSYEKAGLVVRQQPIPWNADCVSVDALIHFPTGMVRRKTDFHLRIRNQLPIAAVTLHRHEEHDLFRLQFRLPTPRLSTPVELYWKSQPLAQAVIPVFAADEFIENLQIQSPTVMVRLGDYTVPCQAFLGNQGKGLIASGMLTSSTHLAPLLDMDLAVEFIEKSTGQTQRVPVRLSGAQLTSGQALISVVVPKRPRRIGLWIVQWTVAGRVLARSEVRVLSQRTLRRGLYLADSRYIHHDVKGLPVVTRHLPTLADGVRVGPCFLVASREPGLAALCALEVRIQHKSQLRTTSLPQQEVLVTDGPSLFLPGTLRAEDLSDIAAFDLVSRGRSLGLLPTSPAPVANFTSEGGFDAPTEYPWNPAADEELADRLGKLMELPVE
jgi:hypothetical protein